MVFITAINALRNNPEKLVYKIIMKFIKQALKTALREIGIRAYTEKSLTYNIDMGLDLVRMRRGRPLTTIFDVGANVGQTSRQMNRAFPDANIYAFEPFQASYDQLTVNTKEIDSIRRFKIALGDVPGKRRVAIEPGSVYNSIKQERSIHAGVEEEISVERIDAFCQIRNIGKIDLLKTDTEGFDLEVLQGAGEMLSSGAVGAIFCEIAFDSRNRQNSHFQPIFNFLTEREFRFYGLYDTFFLHRNTSETAFCDALFCHASFASTK